MTDLAGTVERLRALRPEYPDAYGVEVGEPAEPGWTPLAAVTPAVVAEWCAQALELENPGRLASVAASAVAGELTHVVLGRVAAAVVLERRGWDVHAANIALHRTEDGAVNAAVRDGGLLVLPDDPAAGGPGVTVVPDLGALLDRVAAAAVGTLAPLFVAIRAATRYGMVPLWNGTADSVLAAAAYVPLYAGMDAVARPAARRLGHVFVDTLIRHGAGIRSRGGCERVHRHGETYEVPVRAACCLYYKTEPDVEQPADAYCMTCPFLGPDHRARRFGAYVDHVGEQLTAAAP